MKKCILLFFTTCLFTVSHAQLLGTADVSHLPEDMLENVNPFNVATGVYLGIGDSVMVATTSSTDAFSPVGDTDSSKDTLTSMHMLTKGYTVTNAANETAVLTVYNKSYSYDFTFSAFGSGSAYDKTSEGISQLNSSHRLFKFVEGETDTLVFVNNSTQAIYVRMFQIINYGGTTVISNTPNTLRPNAAKISNPVTNTLSIDLNGNTADLELLSREGQSLKSFHVEGSTSIAVDDLSSGLYILRDITSSSTRKLIIK